MTARLFKMLIMCAGNLYNQYSIKPKISALRDQRVKPQFQNQTLIKKCNLP